MYEPPRDYKNNEANTLYDLYLKAILLDFEIKLISYHAKYDYISECLLDKLVGSYGRYASRIRAHLFHILKDAHLCVHELHRDIVGGILSTHMYERISNNPKLIKEFVELNDWCNNMEFKDTIKYLDLDLASENNVILSNDISYVVLSIDIML